jgi:hypothetical protein
MLAERLKEVKIFIFGEVRETGSLRSLTPVSLTSKKVLHDHALLWVERINTVRRLIFNLHIFLS